MWPGPVLQTWTSQIRTSCLTSNVPSSVTHSIETSSRQSINECSQRILVVTSSGSNGVFFDATRPAMLACDGPMLTSCACTVPATKATNRTTTAFLIVPLQCPRYPTLLRQSPHSLLGIWPGYLDGLPCSCWVRSVPTSPPPATERLPCTSWMRSLPTGAQTCVLPDEIPSWTPGAS